MIATGETVKEQSNTELSEINIPHPFQLSHFTDLLFVIQTKEMLIVDGWYKRVPLIAQFCVPSQTTTNPKNWCASEIIIGGY